MSDPVEMAERHGRHLAELAELGMALARDVQARALAAEDAAAAADLGRTFHTVARTIRQSVALEARLERDRARQAREDQVQAVRETETRLRVRKDQIRSAVERLIWNEAEDDEADDLIERLDDLLDTDERRGHLTDGDVEAHIARARHVLGLSAPDPSPPADAAPTDRPAPSPTGHEATPRVFDGPWRSSA